jgi:hypothetical protein
MATVDAASILSASAPITSPRLPSPPPFTEVQISSTPLSLSSPSSKGSGAAATASSQNTRRIRPGTKSRFMTTGAPLTSLSELDSAFQLQEHLASLITSITCPASSITNFPLDRASCQRLATPPEGVEETLWCYELTRRLTRDLNVLIVALLTDGCTAASCPEMRASEWQYLCAVHESPQSCCAIDYSTHTLDQAATMLTSTKYFPSRLSLLQTSVKHLASIFRRLYRIFAHAWFLHREVFWEVEGEYGLYLFFKTVSDRYQLIPEDNLLLPPEAEGLTGGKSKDGDEVDEEEDEEVFDEWDRGTGNNRSRRDGSGDGEGRDDSDEDDENEEEDPYSDESESDEELGANDEIHLGHDVITEELGEDVEVEDNLEEEGPIKVEEILAELSLNKEREPGEINADKVSEHFAEEDQAEMDTEQGSDVESAEENFVDEIDNYENQSSSVEETKPDDGLVVGKDQEA